VVLFEEQLEKMADENYELQLENATLLAEINHLNAASCNVSKND
jgi:regulator of replication initiation timing